MQELYEYMQFRARRENTRHSLPVEMYADLFAKGCRNVFGVELDDNGKIVRDYHPADILCRYVATTRGHCVFVRSYMPAQRIALVV